MKQAKQGHEEMDAESKSYRLLPGADLAMRHELAERLRKVNAFWSYAQADAMCIPDEVLIEKSFVCLDLPDIALLFKLFRKEYVKKVWKEQMAIQGDYLFDLNVMIAMMYFGIKQPERYLKRIEREHLNQLLGNA